MVPREVLQRRFRVFIVLSLFVLLLEVAGGLLTNSLALLSDAGHVLIDFLALLMAYLSIRLSKKAADSRYSFGYYRSEIISAIVNGVLLVGITVYIFYEAYTRFLSPQPIKGPEMLAVSIVGLLANLYVVVMMHDHEHQNLNVRGAYLHVLSDTLSSVGVVIGGILVVVTGNYIFDPLIGAMIGVFILTNSLQLIKASLRILMEATPENIDIEKLSADIRSIDGVTEVHDLHVWCISSDVYALSSHVLIDAENIVSMNKIVSSINELLKTKYDITHTVIQSECEKCVDCQNHCH